MSGTIQKMKYCFKVGSRYLRKGEGAFYFLFFPYLRLSKFLPWLWILVGWQSISFHHWVHPLGLGQLWQVISQHQIIIKTWNFLCNLQKIVRMYRSLLNNAHLKEQKQVFSIGDKQNWSRTDLEKNCCIKW